MNFKCRLQNGRRFIQASISWSVVARCITNIYSYGDQCITFKSYCLCQSICDNIWKMEWIHNQALLMAVIFWHQISQVNLVKEHFQGNMQYPHSYGGRFGQPVYYHKIYPSHISYVINCLWCAFASISLRTWNDLSSWCRHYFIHLLDTGRRVHNETCELDDVFLLVTSALFDIIKTDCALL